MSDLQTTAPTMDTLAATLAANGVDIDPDTLQEILAAAAAQKLADLQTPVSVGMIAAGRQAWLNQGSSTTSTQVLLAAIYRAMDAVRVAELAAMEVVVAEPPVMLSALGGL